MVPAVRISELSRSSGVPIPTIKYYLRENLLSRGEASAPNQASYSPAHLRRLRLIRSLLDVGGLSIGAARSVLAAVDDPAVPLHEALGATVRPVTTGEPDAHRDEHTDRAAATLARVLAERDWRVSPAAPALAVVQNVLATLYRLGQDHVVVGLDAYGRAVELIAEADLAAVTAVPGREARAETALLGTVLGDALLAALRHLAQEHMSAKHFPPPPRE